MIPPTVAPAVSADGQATPRQFRDAFARLPAGVSVLTTFTPEGPCGMTASAVCSLSLDPPLALVAVARTSQTLAGILAGGSFGINVLHADQAALAERFARPASRPADRFAGVAHDRIARVPVLRHALAWLACDLQAAYPGGDHTILTGLVRATGHTIGTPLVWHERRFTSPA
ncbi:flavin reductase family protein [Streptomyces tagetis]|uniref:Flavin reductase family protein n=1 Tax=Streptomyces tagetis TaxID=2820809 RepID=A0A940XAG3_9ACTN|nr:flavin reductase family protein [Streptomyces sp. RG38]MBQ0826563.1 flavin reductase family protein [Streptomyces sp. RG38]